MQPEVTFSTSCYEKDWEFLLKTNRLEQMIHYNNYPFTHKILYINNITSRNEVEEYAKKYMASGIITNYIFVQDYQKEALNFFEIEENSFDGGLYYSIQHLAAIYLCPTPYLLGFTGDSMLAKPFNWIESAIKKLNCSEILKVANPTWNHRYLEAKEESLYELEDFYISYGFSDQCYLIEADQFRAPIYNEKNIISERYPLYGGNTFEKRVDSWMRNHHFYRLTHKYISYIHKDFPKN
ncbi:MAG: hypothetical protein H6Q75_2 [Firmicutes bacterium]|nr:hypothetical protein [Bacillota bacterium]